MRGTEWHALVKDYEVCVYMKKNGLYRWAAVPRKTEGVTCEQSVYIGACECM